MTPAASLIHVLRARGVVLRLDGDRLYARGTLTPADRAQVAGLRSEVVAALRAEAAALTVADVVGTFPGARIVGSRPVPLRLRCARCGTAAWRPAGSGFVCIRCDGDAATSTARNAISP